MSFRAKLNELLRLIFHEHIFETENITFITKEDTGNGLVEQEVNRVACMSLLWKLIQAIMAGQKISNFSTLRLALVLLYILQFASILTKRECDEFGNRTLLI